MPSAPTQPLRDSLTNLGTAAYDDAQVLVLVAVAPVALAAIIPVVVYLPV